MSLTKTKNGNGPGVGRLPEFVSSVRLGFSNGVTHSFYRDRDIANNVVGFARIPVAVGVQQGILANPTTKTPGFGRRAFEICS